MEHAKIIVIGAGITGLSLAEGLAHRGETDVVVLEQADRAGGVIRSLRQDGVTLEQGPQSLRGTSPVVARLIRRLGIEPLPAHPDAQNRFILRDGRLVTAPSRHLLRKRDVVRALAEPLVPRRTVRDESLYHFIARRFGRGVAEGLLDPVLAGITGGDPRELDLCLFPSLRTWESRYGSVILGALRERSPKADLPRILSVRGGMERLVDALVKRCPDLRLGHAVERVERVSDGFVVHGGDGPLKCRQIAVCVPPSVASSFLPELARSGPWPRAPIAAIHLGYPGISLHGFGWLCPSSERTDVLGALWVSSVFPDHANGLGLVRVMVGGRRAPEWVEQDDDSLVAHARRVVAEVQGIDAEPVLTHVGRHSVGIPQYTVGHGRRVASLPPDLHVIGWGTTGVGLVHCMEAADHTAETLATQVSQPAR